MNLEEIQAFGTAYTAAWNSGEPGAVAAFFEPSGSLKVNEAEPAVGREAVAQVAEGFMTAFPDMVLTMDSVRLTEAGAEYHWTFEGTNTGPGGSGNRVKFSGYEEWTLSEAGLVARSLGSFDEAEYHRQLHFGIEGR
ncbi:MAG: SnoaL-like domain-containing protein [Gemmatimonadetes bacterium]|nr:SnoaL-like domain-containing protein [Gemmatimonadota bacterium]